ncbi:hypothetical protein NLI96_g3727 [Meripilus lineatus]|uniref:Calpain catalytic domain-containing protein n=1 Tax=Meripilus lineatus TaxID=2056292 RepID=A0AAD5VB43_9APHY|nr:hypothetical protein NLI96_g3727 [Physisporinus lineatus]
MAAYTKGTKAELERDFDRAFPLYIQAAEDFLHLSRASTNPSLRASYKALADKALERAEKIKSVKRDIAPVLRNHFDEREQASVLRRSSTVNGSLTPLWGTFSPPTPILQPLLSPEQRKHFAVWKRLPRAEWPLSSPSRPLQADAIIQSVVSDCSVCASIAVCINHDRRWGTKLCESALHPRDEEGAIRETADGRYSLRFLFNGAPRRASTPIPKSRNILMISPILADRYRFRVIQVHSFDTSLGPDIDDQLPSDQEGNLLCMFSGNDRQLLPSLIEKGYMRLMGGYDFPGSNSNIDLHTIIGWIPEHIEIRRLVTILNTWLHPGNEDDCLESQLQALSLERKNVQHALRDSMWQQTHQVAQGQPKHFQLALKATDDVFQGEHEIWVLLTRHVADTRAQSDFVSLYAESGDLLDVNAAHLKGAYISSTHVLVKASISRFFPVLSLVASYDGDDDNVGFTIDAYASIPISWIKETTALPYNEKVMGSFTRKTAGGNPSYPTFMNNPQYRLRFLPDSGPSRPPARGQKATLKIVAQGCRGMPLSINVVWSRGERVTELVSGDVTGSSGPYTYGFAHIRKEVQLEEYVIIVSAFTPQSLGQFILCTESSHRFELTAVPQEGAGMFSKVIRGSWSGDGAAGGPSFKRYTANPTYEIQVSSQTQLKARLQLHEANKITSINLTLFSLGEPRKLGPHIATSGPYSDAVSGVVIPQTTMKAGNYLLIPSTFSPGIEAGYLLIIYSSGQITVNQTDLSA